MRVAARLLHLHDLVEHLRVAAGEERAAVDHHVDLVGAQRDGVLDVAQLDVERRLPGREVGRDARDLDAAARRGAPSPSQSGSGRRRPPRPTERSGSLGSGRIAFEQSAATFPGVSWPSSVVRSQQRSASSSAHTFASFLIERFASSAARCSTATWSIEPIRGSRCFNGSSKPLGSAGAWAIMRV